MRRAGTPPRSRCALLPEACACLLAAAPMAAAAHDPAAASGAGWPMEPWLIVLLAASALLYARGVTLAWRRAGAGRGLRRGDALAFATGWLATVVALAPPLDPLGRQLFSMHMIQHEVLMVVAAPLLVLGRPLAAWSWAWPAGARAVHRAFGAPGLGAAWRGCTSTSGAWLLHAIALWGWHVPRFFEAALASNAVHEWQHATFFATALLFWWSILRGRTHARHQGVALASLFTTMLHTGVLGALLTLSPREWYPAYVPSALALGVDPLQDQQLGGLLMWVPAGAAYLAAALAAAARLLRPAERRPAHGSVP